MIRILFVCHGNICRSPMAEWMMKKRVFDLGLINQFEISSAATSREEIGNDIYPPAKTVLRAHGIPFSRHSARQICENDYEYYDYIVCMDEQNMHNAIRYFLGDSQKKIVALLEHPVADPWYTGNFDVTYNDLEIGIDQLIRRLTESHIK